MTPELWLLSLFGEFVIMALLLAWTVWQRIKADMRVRELEKEAEMAIPEDTGECAAPTPQHERCTGLISWSWYPGDRSVRRCFCQCHNQDTDDTPARRAAQLLTGQVE